MVRQIGTEKRAGSCEKNNQFISFALYSLQYYLCVYLGDNSLVIMEVGVKKLGYF